MSTRDNDNLNQFSKGYVYVSTLVTIDNDTSRGKQSTVREGISFYVVLTHILKPQISLRTSIIKQEFEISLGSHKLISRGVVFFFQYKLESSKDCRKKSIFLKSDIQDNYNWLFLTSFFDSVCINHLACVAS